MCGLQSRLDAVLVKRRRVVHFVSFYFAVDVVFRELSKTIGCWVEILSAGEGISYTFGGDQSKYFKDFCRVVSSNKIETKGM